MYVKVTTFQDSETDIRFVRDTVFGREQGVSDDIEWDGMDPGCVHVVAYDDSGKPVGTGRLQPDGKIGRMAVVKSARQRGVGARMLDVLVAAARDRGLRELHLHAQTHAVSFYVRRGFEIDGDEFMEAGIPHVRMRATVVGHP
ncbi:MAG: GNAT family N-acetyltransferase [Chitinivibrionales bacterium]|nr:GNAT family N-acetyltransferase [Chitinivibrionales bacterium]